MERRSFLRSLAAGVGTLPLLPHAVAGAAQGLDRLAADVAAAATPAAIWQRVREEFQLEPGLAHLNCGSLGATPRLVLDAVTSAMRAIEGNPAVRTFGPGHEQMDEARVRAAAFIGAGADEAAVTRNTTEGMNAVATGLDLEPGDQVLTTNHEHGGGMVCWQYLRRHRGIEIVYVQMPRQVESQQQLVDLVAERLTPRTRVCSFSHIDTITGVRMPLAQIAAITRPRGIVLVCDGAQAPGMSHVDVAALGVDTYACSGHKWMLAPKGSGLLYVRREIQERVHPAFLYDGYGAYTASGGTRNVGHVVGMGATLDFHEAIGHARVVERCRDLSFHLREQLEQTPGLKVLTPAGADLSAAIVTCSLERANAPEVVGLLRQQQIVVKSAQATYAYCAEEDLPRESYNAIRFSTHVFNNESEIDRAVEALRPLL